MTITSRPALTLCLSAAAGLVLIIAAMTGMMFQDQASETVTDTVYLLFIASVGLAASAVCSHFQSRVIRGAAVATWLTVAFAPVVEHIILHPVSIYF